jgi:hypothetical protein
LWGCCAHVASAIWYLGFARHHNLSFDSTYDWSEYLKDASDVEPRLVDTDEEEVEE